MKIHESQDYEFDYVLVIMPNKGNLTLTKESICAAITRTKIVRAGKKGRMMNYVYHLGTVETGARNLIKASLRLKRGERLVVIADQYTRSLMEPVCRLAEIITGRERMHVCYLEDFGPRDKEKNISLNVRRVAQSAAFKRLLRDLGQAEAGVFAGASLGNEFLLRRMLIKAGVANNGRFLLLPNLTNDIMCMGFCSDQAAAQEFTDALLRLAQRAYAAEVVSPAGTKAWAYFGLNWVDCGSVLKPGQWANVGAEIYTCPVSMDGTWVTDGGMGDIFNRYGCLERAPLALELKGNFVVQARSVRRALQDDFRRYMRQDPRGNGMRIGEFALATNPELNPLGLIGVNMQDEKVLPHIAVGDPRRELTMAGRVPDLFQWSSDVHVDLTIRNATITLCMKSGERTVIQRDGQPADIVFQCMRRHAERLQRRLKAIADHCRHNNALPPSQRQQVVRFQA